MRRRLPILGQSVEIELSVRDGAPVADAAFDAARDVSTTVTSFVVARARAAGAGPTCGEGCAACCRHLVPISPIEAHVVARAVEALPPERRRKVERRAEEAIARATAAGLFKSRPDAERVVMQAPRPAANETPWGTVSRRYRELAIGCPMLEGTACSIYERRPLVCREYLVSSAPAECAKPRGAVAVLPQPLRGSEWLRSVHDDLAQTDGLPSVPLFVALAWARQNPLPEVTTAAIARALGDHLAIEG